jgi:hypothetical protein
MSNLPPPQPISLQELTHAVVSQLMSGKSREVVTQTLVARGWPEVSARQFVVNTAQSLTKPQIQAEEDDERHMVAEIFRRRATRDFLFTAGFMIGTLAANDLFPSAPMLSLFFLSMCTFSFVDLLVALIGWWRNR